MTLSEAARKCAELIRARGLAKGTYEDPTGAVCALGAMQKVDSTQGPGTYGPLVLEFSSHVPRIAEWNDAPERTAEEVASLFDYIAEKNA